MAQPPAEGLFDLYLLFTTQIREFREEDGDFNGWVVEFEEKTAGWSDAARRTKLVQCLGSEARRWYMAELPEAVRNGAWLGREAQDNQPRVRGIKEALMAEFGTARQGDQVALQLETLRYGGDGKAVGAL